jgi:uncharacterized protein YjbI with pentapeptide repeats
MLNFSTYRFDRLPILGIALISFFILNLSTTPVYAGVCPEDLEAMQSYYEGEGYTIVSCTNGQNITSDLPYPDASSYHYDTFNAEVCSPGDQGNGLDITLTSQGDPYNLGPKRTDTFSLKSTGGTVDNQQVLDTWSGYSELEIECQGSYNIAYKLTDEIENTVEDPSECCPAGDSCDKPNLPTCESNDQGNPTADDSNSDDTTDISNNDSDNSNIISDQVFLGTTFQGGRDGSETGYFANKEIVNVMFDNITIEYGNDRDWGMVFNNSTIKSTTFQNSQDLPTILFQGSSLDDVTFDNVEMYWPIFFESTFAKSVIFKDSILLRPDFSGVDLTKAEFNNRTVICEANLQDATYTDATFEGSKWFQAYVSVDGMTTYIDHPNNITDEASRPKECKGY